VNQGAAAAALTREIADAGRGVARLVRYDPRWPEGFDFSAGGFVRSFFGPLLALPFYVVFAAMISTKGGAEPLTSGPLWAAAIGHALNTAAFPILVALVARPFGLASGFAAFIVLVNWAGLFVNIALTAISPLTLLGDTGFDILGFAWLILFGLSIFLTWRAARETLSTEVAPALLMVVLSVAVGVAAAQLADVIVAVV
jgi:hypothetical protein